MDILIADLELAVAEVTRLNGQLRAARIATRETEYAVIDLAALPHDVSFDKILEKTRVIDAEFDNLKAVLLGSTESEKEN